jgi:hypothetical protein
MWSKGGRPRFTLYDENAPMNSHYNSDKPALYRPPESDALKPRPSALTFSTAVSTPPLLQEKEPTSPTANPSESGINKYNYAFQALKHFEQTCQRLGWKRIDLDASYKRTIEPEPWGFATEHAEQNFKIDFYEFYQLIERALVLIQKVWGVDVPRSSAGTAAQHNYHESVLRRLSNPDHPLRDYLGTGDGNTALWKAKELRNRWKDAATGKLATHPLRMYDVGWIVTTILDSLQRAYGPSKEKMDEYFHQAMTEGDTQVMETGSQDGPEDWDWMAPDDNMDWE